MQVQSDHSQLNVNALLGEAQGGGVVGGVSLVL